MSGSGISWAICKSAPCSRQITMPAPHNSVFYRPDALPTAQPTASKHWRQNRHVHMVYLIKASDYQHTRHRKALIGIYLEFEVTCGSFKSSLNVSLHSFVQVWLNSIQCTGIETSILTRYQIKFSALMLLVGRQEGHPACKCECDVVKIRAKRNTCARLFTLDWNVKNWVVGCWRGYLSWSDVQACIWPSWCHCHSLSLASDWFYLSGTSSPG